MWDVHRNRRLSLLLAEVIVRLTTPIDEEEFSRLRVRYGAFPLERVRLDVGRDFLREDRRPVKPGRRAEVLLVVVGPDGRILVHTKAFYPPGTFRLLSGGVQVGEPVEEALARELREETGASAVDHCFIGILDYDIRCEDEHLTFASYVYRVNISTSVVRPGDEEEQISEFRWVSFSYLPHIRDALLQVPPAWQDWGRFRALGHDFVLRYAQRCGIAKHPAL